MYDNPLTLTVASGEDLDVRQFNVFQAMNALYRVDLVALSKNAAVDFQGIIGLPATFIVEYDKGKQRTIDGICTDIQQVLAEDTGLSTYRLTIMPKLWFASQRRNHRMFQQITEPDIVKKILGEWGVAFEARIDTGAYKKRKYRVQYGESDFGFISRLLEDSGISYYFDDTGKMILVDEPHTGPFYKDLPFWARPSGVRNTDYSTAVSVTQRVRPGRYAVRDHDYRKSPDYPLLEDASDGLGPEQKLERFHYVPGAFLFASSQGESTPVADDKGKTRIVESEGKLVAERRLQAKRSNALTYTFESNAFGMTPGMLVGISEHPNPMLAEGRHLILNEVVFNGSPTSEWHLQCHGVTANAHFRPTLDTPKPRVMGVESATVVGPPGEEIHTDEFGRVRVHFHWDRESGMDDNSSCWIHVSQPWGGTGFGGMNIPRVGQEVLVNFLGGDPDRPVIVGRVYTGVQRVPYKLPDQKTKSGWRSNSSPGGGGFNEIMFEDLKGSELMYVQAEKDRIRLTKNDEAITVGHDRTKHILNDESTQVDRDRSELVKRDETITIGQDRTEMVARDEQITIGNDRTEAVGNNESILVGSNRSKSVGSNESLMVGVNQSESVGVNRSLQVGANNSETVGASKSVTVGAAMSTNVGGSMSEAVGLAKAETVALASAETVGLAKALSIGAMYNITVGASMTTMVGGSSSESVSKTKTVAVGEKITIQCGASIITMDKDGNIAISGKDLTVTASGKVKVVATGDADIESAANVVVRGSQINMN